MSTPLIAGAPQTAFTDALYLREFARALALAGARAVLAATNEVADRLGGVKRPAMHRTSARRAVTSGCSGTWATHTSSGHSRTRRRPISQAVNPRRKETPDDRQRNFPR